MKTTENNTREFESFKSYVEKAIEGTALVLDQTDDCFFTLGDGEGDVYIVFEGYELADEQFYIISTLEKDFTEEKFGKILDGLTEEKKNELLDVFCECKDYERIVK